MKNNNDKALEQISLIKNVIDETKIKWETLSNILFYYGIMNLIFYLIQYGSSFFSFHNQAFSITELILEKAAIIGLFIYYMYSYRKEKATANKYYIGILNLCGIILFAIPFIMSIISIYYILINSDNMIKAQSYSILINQEMTANIILFFFCAVICGLISQHHGITAISVIIMSIYLILSSVFKDSSLSYSLTNSASIDFPLYGIYYTIVTSVGYIVLGLTLRKQGRSVNGIK
jgi:hypothetical protein